MIVLQLHINYLVFQRFIIDAKLDYAMPLPLVYNRVHAMVGAVVALGFVVVALIGAVYALGCIVVLWLEKLGSGLRALGGLVSVRYRQPFAKTTTIGLSEAKEQVS